MWLNGKKYNSVDFYRDKPWFLKRWKKRKKPISSIYLQISALKHFHSQCSKANYRKRLELLKEMSILNFDNKIPYQIRRELKHPIKFDKPCFCCKYNQMEVKHHIVQIKNGGMDIGLNRIGICNVCHSRIHHWLRPVYKEIEKLDSEYKEMFKPYVVPPARSKI